MTARWLVVLAACGSAPPPPPSVPAPVAPIAKRPHPRLPWSWQASTSQPWRLHEEASEVVIAAPDLAVLRTYAGSLSELSLTTGIATAPADLAGQGGRIFSIVRDGNRVLAFGRADGAPAAWEITPHPLAAHAIALPDPMPEPPVVTSRPSATMSPDGARILVCNSLRAPTIRDAGTLAVIRVFRDSKCGRPHFADSDHVIFGDDKLALMGDIATGVVHPAPAISYGGPGGRTLSLANHKQRLTDANGKVLYEAYDNLIGQVRWTPDGRAINLGLAQLAIRPATTLHEIALPFDFNHFDVDDHTAVVVQGQTAIAIDLETGALRLPEGNVGSVGHLGVRGGTVYALSDRLRMFRAGELARVGDTQIMGFDIGSPIAPVITTGSAAVTLWDPATDSKRTLAEVTFGTVIAHAGTTIVYDDFDTLYRSDHGGPAARWAHFHSDASLDAIDVATGRVVWDWQDAYHVVEIDAKTITSFTVPDFGGACGHGNKIRFAPGGGFVIEAMGQLHLHDGWGTWTGGIEMPVTLLAAWEIVPTTGEVVMTGPEQIAIWNPDGNRVVVWKPPTALAPEQVAIAESGNELAVAYADGSVLWADLREVRSHAVPIDAVPIAADACATPPPAMKLDDLLLHDPDP